MKLGGCLDLYVISLIKYLGNANIYFVVATLRYSSLSDSMLTKCDSEGRESLFIQNLLSARCHGPCFPFIFYFHLILAVSCEVCVHF
jgi:hypothetical protein